MHRFAQGALSYLKLSRQSRIGHGFNVTRKMRAQLGKQGQFVLTLKLIRQLLKNPLNQCKRPLLVEGLVIIEVKAVMLYNKIFEAQALTYLRLMDLKLALVINFGDARVGSGIHRVVNGL